MHAYSSLNKHQYLYNIRSTFWATLGLILFNAIIKKTNVTVKSRIKAITYRHEKKLNNLRKLQQNYVNTKTKQHPVEQITYNFSSYVLSLDKEIALSYRFDKHIPSNLNKTDIEAEFEQFYHGLLKDFSNIPEENLSTLKTKLGSTCEKYTRIKVPYKYQQTVKKLSKNQSIVIMKQDKRSWSGNYGQVKIPREMFNNTRK